MSGLKSVVAAFCKTYIDPKIEAGGLRLPEKDYTIVLFYAGPSGDVVTFLRQKKNDSSFSPKLNWTLSADEASRLKANRIDDVSLFPYLTSSTFKNDLKNYIGKLDYPKAHKMIWDQVSEKFSQTTPFQEAYTFVCGADVKSSFRSKELLGMLKNAHMEVCNKRTASLFRAFKPLGRNEVFALSCATYLMTLRAAAKITGDAGLKVLYKNQRAYYLIWRNAEKELFRAKPKATRLRFKKKRSRILERHKELRLTE